VCYPSSDYSTLPCPLLARALLNPLTVGGGGQSARPATAGRHEGAILAPNLSARKYLITGRHRGPHRWRASKEGPVGLSKPTGLNGRVLGRSQQPLVSLPRYSLARITSGLLSLNRERGISGATICLTSAAGCRVVTSHNLELFEKASWGLDIEIRHVGRKMSSDGSSSPG
jgi:hypothetical protein